MSKGNAHPRQREGSRPSPPRSLDEKKVVVEFTRSFDENFVKLPGEIQEKCRRTIEAFIHCYASRQFPKSLRVHKCGPFLSISISMRHRVLVLPVAGGIRFVFVGDHEDADRYLR